MRRDGLGTRRASEGHDLGRLTGQVDEPARQIAGTGAPPGQGFFTHHNAPGAIMKIAPRTGDCESRGAVRPGLASEPEKAYETAAI